MVCRGKRVTLYSLNGSLLIDQVICDSDDDFIMSCAFYEGESNEWLERELLFTGHKRGVVNVRLDHLQTSLYIINMESRYGVKL